MSNNISVDGTITGGTETLVNPTMTGAINIGGAGDTIGVYGATPVSRRASSIQATSVISAYSSTTASALIGALLVEIANTLTGLGLWKGSA
jgi:hypothetical protein